MRLRPLIDSIAPTPLRAHRRLWATIARVILLAGVLLFLELAEVPGRSRLVAALFDAGHVMVFAVVAWLIGGLLAGRVGRWGVFGVTLGVAAASEIVQFLVPGRDVSRIDFLRDAAGAGAWLLLHWRVRGNAAAHTGPDLRRRQVGAVAGAVAMLCAAGWQLALTTAGQIARNRAFPVIASFDGTWWERPIVSTEHATLVPRAGSPGASDRAPTRLARLDLQPARYPGLNVIEPYPDWRGYRHLVVTITSDLDTPLHLVLRVHDAAHDGRYRDRFNRVLQVQPGTSELRIALDDIRRAPDRRELDLGRVRAVLLFASDLRSPAHLYLGPMRLE